MADKLDEGPAHEVSYEGLGADQVEEGDERVHKTHGHGQEDLEDHVTTTVSRQALVPQGGQQLLAVRVGHELKHQKDRFDIFGYRPEHNSRYVCKRQFQMIFAMRRYHILIEISPGFVSNL